MANRKRILFVQHAGVGGAVVSLSQIIGMLDQARYEPVVLLFQRNAQALELLQRCGAQVLIEPGLVQFRHATVAWEPLTNPLNAIRWARNLSRLPSSFHRFGEILDLVQPDLVYLNALPLFHYSYVTWRRGTPTILHVREPVHDGHLGVRKWIHRWVIHRYPSQVICIETYDAQQLGLSPNQYELIPNYVDLQLWDPNRYQGQQPPGNGRTNILFLGGLGSVKGLPTLLEALVLLKDEDVDFTCTVCGLVKPSSRLARLKAVARRLGVHPPYELLLQAIEQLQLQRHCVLKPFLLSPVSEFAQADIVVFPSTTPHFPRPLVEAGAMGLPVVASDLPGPQDVVAPGQSGLLVPPGHPQALARALQLLMVNRQLRQQMGARGREIVEERFNGAVNQARIVHTIERVSAGYGDRSSRVPIYPRSHRSTPTKVGVSLAVFNSREQTRECLEALLRSEGIELFPVVVDDGSTDGTSEMVAEEFPTVTLLQGDGTLWWTGATNWGIRRCLEAGCDYVLLINPDVLVESRTVSVMVAESQRHGHAIVTPLILDRADPTRIWEAGHRWEPVLEGLPLFWVTRYQYKRGTLVSQVPSKTYSTNSVVGRGGLLPRQAFARLGLFDEKRLPHYGADVDMTLRAWRHHYPMVVAPAARVLLNTEQTGMTVPSSLDRALSHFRRYLFSRKQGEAVRVLFYWNVNNLPIFVAIPNYLFLLGLNSVRYWQHFLRQRSQFQVTRT